MKVLVDQILAKMKREDEDNLSYDYMFSLLLSAHVQHVFKYLFDRECLVYKHMMTSHSVAGAKKRSEP